MRQQRVKPMTIGINDCYVERRGLEACPSFFDGKGSTVFCCRPKGHSGDHRGPARQWRDVPDEEDS